MKLKHKIYCIHPYDRTTQFLERIVNHLRQEFGSEFHCFKVKANNASHLDCLKAIEVQKNNFVLFLGHGKSNLLYGACGDNADNLFTSGYAQEESSSHYKNEQFLFSENIGVLKSNIVLSLSCNSNEKGKNCLGVFAIQTGAKSFIGFGDIPTDYDEQVDFTEREIAIFKGIINRVIKKSIAISFKKNFTVEKLVDTIKILTNKEIQNLIYKHKGVKYRHRIAKHLFRFKEDIVIFGDRYAIL